MNQASLIGMTMASTVFNSIGWNEPIDGDFIEDLCHTFKDELLNLNGQGSIEDEKYNRDFFLKYYLMEISECLDNPVSEEELFQILDVAQGEILGLISRHRSTKAFMEKLARLEKKFGQ